VRPGDEADVRKTIMARRKPEPADEEGLIIFRREGGREHVVDPNEGDHGAGHLVPKFRWVHIHLVVLGDRTGTPLARWQAEPQITFSTTHPSWGRRGAWLLFARRGSLCKSCARLPFCCV